MTAAGYKEVYMYVLRLIFLLLICILCSSHYVQASNAELVAAVKRPADFHGVYLFGMKGILPRTSKRWQQYRDNMANIVAEHGTGLGEKACEQMKAWQGRKLDMTLVKDVNEYWNHNITYKYDDDYHGRKRADEWMTPVELEKRQIGDCEDYALAKYQMLKELGWNTDDMFMLITSLEIGYLDGHAVLVVYHDKELYILDNFTDEIKTHERYEKKLIPGIYTETGYYSLYHVRNKKIADQK